MQTRLSQLPAEHRSGVTLTEILVAMMIMAIGITMVMALFPISALRTLQATQLTNATILKQNVEALMEVNPGLVFDPDGDGNFTEHYDTADPDFESRNYVVDPLAYYVRFTDGVLTGTPTALLPSGTAGDGDLFAGALGIPRFGGFAVPYGYPLTDASESRAAVQLGRSLASQGDGWTTMYDVIPQDPPITTTGGNVIGVTLPGIDLSEVPYSSHPTQGVPGTPTPLIADREDARIVVFSIDERISQSFPLTHISGQNVYWSEDTNADDAQDVDFNLNGVFDIRNLPLEFYIDTNADNAPDTAKIGRVVLQIRRPGDFTWLLTVRRRADGMARNVDIVVRYKNATNVANEATYSATFLANVPYVGVDIGAAEAPEISRGQFLFNVAAARWYRIEDVQERPVFGWGGAGIDLDALDVNANYEYVIRLDTDVKPADSVGLDAANNELDGDEVSDWTDVSQFGTVMFPKGIVEVYPTGYRSPP